MRRRALIGAIVASAMSALMGLGGVSYAEENVLRYVPATDLPTLDPSQTTATVVGDYGYLVFDTLFAMNSKLQPQPQMVDTFTVSDDKLTYTFTLRDGLKWHDGAPVKAEDCVASLNRFFKKDGQGTSLKDSMESLTAVDDKTFVMKLKQPYGLVLDTLAKINQVVPFMYPKRLAESDPEKPFADPIGSGPFKFDKASWKPGSQIVFVKNPDYVPRKEPQDLLSGGKVAKVDRIEWKIFSDNQTAVNALIAGEVDMMEQPASDSRSILRGTKGMVVEAREPGGWTIVIRFNSLNAPFNDAKARRAVAMIINQSEYLKTVAGPNEGKVCKSVFTCNSPYTSDIGTEAIGSGDVEKAKQLLKEAGYNGEKIVLLQPTDEVAINGFALVAAQELRSIGINVELAPSDWPTLVQRRSKKVPVSEGGWNIFITTSPPSSLATPAVNLPGISSCDTAWAGWPCDEKIEAVRKEFTLTADPAKRKELADAFQQRVLELATWVPGGQFLDFAAWRDVVTDVVIGPMSPLYGVSKKTP